MSRKTNSNYMKISRDVLSGTAALSRNAILLFLWLNELEQRYTDEYGERDWFLQTNDELANKTGMCLDSIKKAKKELKDKGFIEITQNNGLYFIGYGAGYSKRTGEKYYSCTTRGFEKITDAVETLKRHRPQAEQIKDYCSRCKQRKMLSYDYDNHKAEYADCNGELYKTCYTGCIYCK